MSELLHGARFGVARRQPDPMPVSEWRWMKIARLTEENKSLKRKLMAFGYALAVESVVLWFALLATALR